MGWPKLAQISTQGERILSCANRASLIECITKIIVSSHCCFMCTIAFSPQLLLDSFVFTLFPTLVMSFGRLQLLCCNGELTISFQIPSSSNIKTILLYSKVRLLHHFAFSHLNFSIAFINIELTNAISPYIMLFFSPVCTMLS